MSVLVYFENNLLYRIECTDLPSLKQKISQQCGVPAQDLFITVNGKIVSCDTVHLAEDYVVRACTKLLGGKGGFGSMLRAIGTQIQRTTNREACRDLSGRRLRDIHEEVRLKKWFEREEDRKREAAERKQKKLEKLTAELKPNVTLNPKYEEERHQLSDRVTAAVDAGWKAAETSNETRTKRKAEDDKLKERKKLKLWIDTELSDCSLSDDEEIESSDLSTTNNTCNHNPEQEEKNI